MLEIRFDMESFAAAANDGGSFQSGRSSAA
jgi:hypothetical protein